MSTDGTNIYVASPNSVAKYDQNGNLLWTVPWTNGPNYGVARYAAGVLYICGGYGMPGGYVAALNAATGNQLWNTPIADGAPTDLSAAGDVYVITSANNAKRLNASTGAVVWTATAGTAGVGWAVSATSEGVYVSGGWRGGNYYKTFPRKRFGRLGQKRRCCKSDLGRCMPSASPPGAFFFACVTN